jgi:hypothetical protein
LVYNKYGDLTNWPWPDNIIVGNPLGPTLYDDLNKSYQILSNGEINESGEEIDDVVNQWFIGHPIGVNYDFVWDGVWQLDEETEAANYGSQPGYVKLKDYGGELVSPRDTLFPIPQDVIDANLTRSMPQNPGWN